MNGESMSPELRKFIENIVRLREFEVEMANIEKNIAIKESKFYQLLAIAGWLVALWIILFGGGS